MASAAFSRVFSRFVSAAIRLSTPTVTAARRLASAVLAATMLVGGHGNAAHAHGILPPADAIPPIGVSDPFSVEPRRYDDALGIRRTFSPAPLGVSRTSVARTPFTTPSLGADAVPADPTATRRLRRYRPFRPRTPTPTPRPRFSRPTRPARCGRSPVTWSASSPTRNTADRRAKTPAPRQNRRRFADDDDRPGIDFGDRTRKPPRSNPNERQGSIVLLESACDPRHRLRGNPRHRRGACVRGPARHRPEYHRRHVEDHLDRRARSARGRGPVVHHDRRRVPSVSGQANPAEPQPVAIGLGEQLRLRIVEQLVALVSKLSREQAIQHERRVCLSHRNTRSGRQRHLHGTGDLSGRGNQHLDLRRSDDDRLALLDLRGRRRHLHEDMGLHRLESVHHDQVSGVHRRSRLRRQRELHRLLDGYRQRQSDVLGQHYGSDQDSLAVPPRR